MKRLRFLIVIGFAAFTVMSGQEETKEKDFGIRFGGYVKYDAFYDSRQTVAVREGHFLLWPANESIKNGKDINDNPTFNMLAVQSRLSGSITGPDAFGAETSGKIEVDFFAQANDNINLLRLRHAFFKLKWESGTLTMGQTWNPFFVTGCYPGTVSFNTGVPFQPFARNPQIRYTHHVGGLRLIGAALAQRDYASRAFDEDKGKIVPSSSYLRNATMPDLHFQVHYGQSNKEAGTGYLFGGGVAYKTIVPRLMSSVEIVDTAGNTDIEQYKVDESVSGLSGLAFVKIKTKPVTFKLEGVYGQNLVDVLQIGGFSAIKEDLVNGKRSYEPVQVMSFWTDIHLNNTFIQPGIFAGYSQNIGTVTDIIEVAPNMQGLGTNIYSLMRVSPRVAINSGKTRFALEGEYTVAQYGSSLNNNAIPKDLTEIDNLRILFSAYYFF